MSGAALKAAVGSAANPPEEEQTASDGRSIGRGCEARRPPKQASWGRLGCHPGTHGAREWPIVLINPWSQRHRIVTITPSVAWAGRMLSARVYYSSSFLPKYFIFSYFSHFFFFK